MKEILNSQLENSESFRTNTERTLNKIKEEFEMLVSEFDEIKNMSSYKSFISKKDVSSLNSQKNTGNISEKKPYYQVNSARGKLKNNNKNQQKTNKTEFSTKTKYNNEIKKNIPSNDNNEKIEKKQQPIFNINLNSLTINNNLSNLNSNHSMNSYSNSQKTDNDSSISPRKERQYENKVDAEDNKQVEENIISQFIINNVPKLNLSNNKK